MNLRLKAALTAGVVATALGGCDSRGKGDEAQSKPKTIYRWKGRDGSLHFTDDPSSIPKGAKVEETEGAEIKVVAASKVDAGNLSEVGTEVSWRARFRETRKRIAELERLIAQDKRIVGDAETNEMLQEAQSGDVQFENAMIRIKASRQELKRQQAALTHLNSVADGVNVPDAWRE